LGFSLQIVRSCPCPLDLFPLYYSLMGLSIHALHCHSGPASLTFLGLRRVLHFGLDVLASSGEWGMTLWFALWLSSHMVGCRGTRASQQQGARVEVAQGTAGERGWIEFIFVCFLELVWMDFLDSYVNRVIDCFVLNG
jgi:hypothetical protein